MNRLSIEQVLLDFAKTMLKDLGPKDGRAYLLRNIPLWRKEYGEAVTDRVSKGIRELLRSTSAS